MKELTDFLNRENVQLIDMIKVLLQNPEGSDI